MKFFKLLALTLALGAIFSGCGSKYKYETVANDPLNAKIYTLPNGLKSTRNSRVSRLISLLRLAESATLTRQPASLTIWST